MTIFSVGVPSSPRWRSCSQQALLQVARRDADRVERLHVLERPLDVGDRPLAHRGDLLHRRDEVAVVVEVADDRRADLAEPFVVGLQRELPHQVVGERGRRRERVLDRRQLLDLGRLREPVAVVEVVAEEILVVGVVPGVAFLGGRLVGSGFSGALLFGRLQLLGRDLFEQRVLHHLLVQQLGQLERRHRQQLDRLLERRRQDELLNESGMEFLLNRHGSIGRVRPHNLSPTGSPLRGKSASRPRRPPGCRAFRSGKSRRRGRCRPGP